MKTRILVCTAALALSLVGCNKDDDKSSNTPLTAAELKANADMDDISDDVGYIAESESGETSSAGRTSGGNASFLSDCATITTTVTGNIWTRTIDFGTTNCNLVNGNAVRGKIIIVFNNDFAAATRTINYSFDNFYHNNRHVEGSRNVVITKVNGHPVATVDLNLTVTTADGAVYHRTGQRIREFTAGYDTWFYWGDNQFSITGSWVTTFPSGTVQTATITAPLIIHMDCFHILSGNITFTRNSSSATAVLDYGDGECDDQATLTINGNVYPIDLGI